MSHRTFKLGLLLAFFAAAILTLPGCGTTDTERWDSDVLLEQTPLEPVKFRESMTAGKLTVTATQKTRTRQTPIERLTLVHEQTYMELDWDNFGLTFFAIVGGIVSVGLYFVFAFLVFDKTDDKKD